MSEKIKEIMNQTIIDTLERLAFIFAGEEDDLDDLEYNEKETAKLYFDGVFSGILAIEISKDALPELAVNMLGVDDEDEVTPEQQHDTLKETLNIICGNLLPMITSRKHVFNIGTPEIVSEDNDIPGNENLNQEISTRLSLDEGQCKVSLFINDEAGVILKNLE